MAISKEISDRAIRWLKNTTIEPKKIADHMGFCGPNRIKFLVFAKKYRKELWEELDAMTKRKRLSE